MNPKLVVALVLTGTWFVLAASCTGEEEGGPTPAAVAERLTELVRTQDYGRLLQVLAPDDRNPMILSVVGAAAKYAQGSDEAAAALAALLKRHRLEGRSLGETDAATYLKGVNKPALFQDAMELALKYGRGQLAVPSGEISGVVVEGSRARAKLGGRRVDFVKVAGNWYVEMPRD